MGHEGRTARRKGFCAWHLGFLLVLAVTVSPFPGGENHNATGSSAKLSARHPKPDAPEWPQTTEDIRYAVKLIPQPDKNSCWAAAMAMLLSFREGEPYDPESLAREVGLSLSMTMEDAWKLLEAVRDRFGFEAIDVPSNSSLYFPPAEWADWLHQYGPLWVVIVGAPHAVVVSGLKGDLEDPESCEVLVLDPWDSRATFDDDPIEFHPANEGFADWLPFMKFASYFGDVYGPAAKDDKGNDLTYEGNWRVLYLPKREQASAAFPLTATGW